MKNNREFKLLILAVALLAMTGAVFMIRSIVQKNETPSTEAPTETYSVFELGDETVTKLSWTLKDYPGVDYTFSKKEDGTWQYDPDPSFKVKHQLISSLVGYTRGTNAYRKVQLKDLAAMGLDPAAGTIVITTSGGREATLIYGDLTSSGQYYYGMNGDGNVYLLKNTVFPYFNKALSEFEDVEEPSSEGASS